MDFETVLRTRQSNRKFQKEQISEENLQRILLAAMHAPVGSKMYQDLHITVVQDQSILLKLCEAAWERFSSHQKVEEIAGKVITEKNRKPRNNLFYDAPTVIFVSHRKQSLQPGIEWANVVSVVNQMHLEATNLGLGSCYMWGALESMRMLPELDHTDLLHLPDGLEPLFGLAVGYPVDRLEEKTEQHRINANRL